MAGGEAAAPLLEKKEAVYREGCPGCAVERRKALNPGVPYKEFFHIWTIILASCLPVSSLFPFLYFMIRDLHIAKTVEDIGFYAGFVGASYMLGRTLTSTAWGMVADRIGRKPVIVLGIFSVILFSALFGLSVHYWMAISTRFLLGSLNGIIGPIRAYAIEVCRPEHHAIALSLVSTAWAIGLIVGPTIGGYLAQPTEKYPKLFPVDSLFGRFPYFLPCLCISVFSFLVLISCIWLPIFSLWAESDRKYGGLSFSSEDVGQVLAITGVSILVYQTFIFPRINRVLGPINTSRVAISLSVVLLFTYAPITHLSRPWSSIAVNIASILKNNFLITIVTSSFILQNNSVTQGQRATANGLGTTLMSFCKTFAPAGAGIVFSWAQKRQHVFFFPGDQMLFFLLAIVELVGLVWTFKPFLVVPDQFSSN
ncbi:protein ZINC INDUCED FACILITATOR-LIKE 1 isoform X2 [Aegilops tauschii subsp. strangulata]|uniref:protein ZINC INDUCED FACILITATOR-LIKE 1 isoform X2 n=1 Tax=Aegilops tauschii subsp. strangulata TaxID=200361 RepID=UPI00098B3D55|nr:probable peptide/nitrate transporter At3g43790 isoform X2 [Aegilops tauschii subsp. strangulata]